MKPISFLVNIRHERMIQDIIDHPSELMMQQTTKDHPDKTAVLRACIELGYRQLRATPVKPD